jgi:hypothetical protein
MYENGVVSVTSTATPICTPTTLGVLAQNLGTATVTLGGPAVTAGGGVALLSGGAPVLVPSGMPPGVVENAASQLYGIVASGSANVGWLSQG